MKKGGFFVTFEGGDGAGKTTLVGNLARRLKEKGLPVVLTRAPGGTDLGQKIRDLLLHGKDYAIAKRAELFLFLADRAQHVEQLIRPALEDGKIVLCDRFNDSTIAYQGHARGLSEDIVAKQCALACDGVQPDCTFYLDIAPQIGLERVQKGGAKDRIEAESLEFHEKIRSAFLRIAKREPERVFILDASLPLKEVERQAWEKLDALLAAKL